MKKLVFIPKSVFRSKYKIPYYADEIQKHNWLKKVAREKFIYQGNSNKRFSSTIYIYIYFQIHIYASNLELVQDYNCILVLILQDFVGNMAMH